MVKKPYPLTALERVRKESTERAAEDATRAQAEAVRSEEARGRSEAAKADHDRETERVVAHEDLRLEDGRMTAEELANLARFRDRRAIEESALRADVARKEEAEKAARLRAEKARGELGEKFAEEKVVARHHEDFVRKEKAEEGQREELELEELRR